MNMPAQHLQRRKVGSAQPRVPQRPQANSQRCSCNAVITLGSRGCTSCGRLWGKCGSCHQLFLPRSRFCIWCGEDSEIIAPVYERQQPQRHCQSSARTQHSSGPRCTTCNAQGTPGARFCINCGDSLGLCGGCGQQHQPHHRFCIFCGYTLAAAQTKQASGYTLGAAQAQRASGSGRPGCLLTTH